MSTQIAIVCATLVSRVLDNHPDIYESELYQFYCSPKNLKMIDYRYNDVIWSSELKNVTKLTKNYPKSIHMKNIGWAAFHSSMEDHNRTALFFRSGKYGSYGHSSAEQLCFTMVHKSQPMLISSGYYDYYYSPHHRNWRQTTRAQSGGITMDGGIGQTHGTMEAYGTITQFGTSDQFDYVTGDALAAYNAGLEATSPLRLTRVVRSLVHIRAFNQFLILDQIDAASPRLFEWNLHAYNNFTVVSPSVVQINQNGVTTCINMLHPSVPLTFWQTDQFPANAPVAKPNQWHGQFKAEQYVSSISFVVLIDPDCTGHVPEIQQNDGRWEFHIDSTSVIFDGNQLVFVEPPVTGSGPISQTGSPHGSVSASILVHSSVWTLVVVFLSVVLL
jgi:hypothetical protein